MCIHLQVFKHLILQKGGCEESSTASQSFLSVISSSEHHKENKRAHLWLIFVEQEQTSESLCICGGSLGALETSRSDLKDQQAFRGKEQRLKNFYIG